MGLDGNKIVIPPDTVGTQLRISNAPRCLGIQLLCTYRIAGNFRGAIFSCFLANE